MLARTQKGKPSVSASPDDAVDAESGLHADIIKECKRRGWLYFHGSMAHRARRTLGEPDFVILADRGRVFFFECKKKNGKRSPEQIGVAIWGERLGHQIHLIEGMSQFLAIVDAPDSAPLSP